MTDRIARVMWIGGSALIGVGMVMGEWIETARGAPGSVPFWVPLWAHNMAPLLGLLILAVTSVAVPVLSFRSWRTIGEDRLALRRWVGVLALGALIIWGGFWVSPRLRLARLEARAATLTPSARAYFADPTRPLPTLNIRGCFDLKLGSNENELRASCPRTIGAWDDMVYSQSESYPASYTRLGAWGYYWD